MSLTRVLRSAGQRIARGLRLQPPHRDACDGQRVDSLQCRWQWRGVEQGEPAFGVVKPTDQQQAAHLEIARVCCVDVVAMLFECDAGGIKRLLRPAEVP